MFRKILLKLRRNPSALEIAFAADEFNTNIEYITNEFVIDKEIHCPDMFLYVQYKN